MAAVLVAASIAAWAARPGVGEAAPEFVLRGLDGKEVRFSAEWKKGPVALVVLRGYPGYQCPICNRQVKEFIGKGEEFAKAGACVVMVYPGPAEGLEARAKEFAMDKMLPGHFVMVLDPDYAFTNLYGLRWEAKGETAYPATFVVGKDGKVKWTKVSDSHAGRASAAEALSALASR
jgi:peroxiredoxin